MSGRGLSPKLSLVLICFKVSGRRASLAPIDIGQILGRGGDRCPAFFLHWVVSRGGVEHLPLAWIPHICPPSEGS
jgi:hypothetical protein